MSSGYPTSGSTRYSLLPSTLNLKDHVTQSGEEQEVIDHRHYHSAIERRMMATAHQGNKVKTAFAEEGALVVIR